jgi:hypothetical protein
MLPGIFRKSYFSTISPRYTPTTIFEIFKYRSVTILGFKGIINYIFHSYEWMIYGMALKKVQFDNIY